MTTHTDLMRNYAPKATYQAPPVMTVGQLAEGVLQWYKMIAYSSDRNVAGSWNETYKRAQGLLFATIRSVYPEVDPDAVYGVFLDCGEDLAYCVQQVREMSPEDIERFKAW